MREPDLEFDGLAGDPSRKRSGSRPFYGSLAVGSLISLVPEFQLMFALGFAPGWANGWGFGLTIFDVWPAGMTLIFFIMMATCSVCLAASLAWLTPRLAMAQLRAATVLRIALPFGLFAAIVAASFLHESLRLEAREMWPGGYP